MKNFSILIFFTLAPLIQAQSALQAASMSIDWRHPTKISHFSQALGGGIDGHDVGETEKMLSPKNIQAMQSSGLKPLAYRLRTELGIEAWHWNPQGTWSDPTHQQGYWTSSTTSKTPILKSYGYRLPRRGSTLDEANNDGYSRLDDGDPATFWKSNPYLTSHYTGESDARHPQWIIVDFGKPVLINAARLHWKNPYAKKFRIQYSQGGALYFGNNVDWHDFPKGKFTNASGSSSLLDLGTPRSFFGKKIPVQFIRILMTESSGTSMVPSSDPRDHAGYALGEIEFGCCHAGIFHDHIIHRPDQAQTLIYASSTDPWHRAIDCDKKTEQPGLELVATSGLGNQQPILWSIPLFYDTPENGIAAIDFLKSRGYLFPQQRLELGEEPDGQRVDPNDVAELYAQIAKPVQQKYPDLHLGGLSFVTIDVEHGDLIYRVDKRSWLRRFFKQLEKKKTREQFQFLTFEWYPFDDFLLPAALLLCKQPGRLRDAIERLRHGGIPKKMPLIISEYGYSVFSGEPEVTMAAALLNADIAAQFLLLGGTVSYLYGYEPNRLECTCGDSWGNLMMFLQQEDGAIQPLPTYYGAQLVTTKWGPPSGGACNLYPATIYRACKKRGPFFCHKSDVVNEVTAYFLHANASAFHKEHAALLVVNKNPKSAYRLHLSSQHATESALQKKLQGVWECTSYSPAEYEWRACGAHGHPLKNKVPTHSRVSWNNNVSEFVVEPWSVTVFKKRY